jgi:hypothetical protein
MATSMRTLDGAERPPRSPRFPRSPRARSAQKDSIQPKRLDELGVCSSAALLAISTTGRRRVRGGNSGSQLGESLSEKMPRLDALGDPPKSSDRLLRFIQCCRVAVRTWRSWKSWRASGSAPGCSARGVSNLAAAPSGKYPPLIPKRGRGPRRTGARGLLRGSQNCLSNLPKPQPIFGSMLGA